MRLQFFSGLFLLSLTGCISPMTKAVHQNDVTRIKQLVDAGADINKGQMVYSAVRYNSADALTYLLEHGVDPKKPIADKSPLTWAMQFGSWKAVKILLEYGADAERAADWGENAESQQPKTYRGLKEKSNRLRRMAGLPVYSAPIPITNVAAPPILSKNNEIVSDVDSPTYKNRVRENDFAIVIGIDDYKDLPNAQFAERDADAMHKHLIAMGYPKRHVVLLKGQNATRTGLQKYLEEWLPRNVKPTSNVFFYYSGHGAPDTNNGKAYLVPWDGDAKFLRTTAYSIEELYSALKALKAKNIVVALDACFSGAGGRSVLAKGVRPLVTKVDTAVNQAGRIVSFGAAQSDEITAGLEEESHGIFTYFFLKGLNGAAKNSAGEITVKSLYQYLKPQVQAEARLQNREQTPTVSYRTNVVLRAR